MAATTPRKGTVLRAVFDAEHARWCGPDCPPSCREWHPDLKAMRAGIDAVRQFDLDKLNAIYAREMAAMGLPVETGSRS